MIQFYNVLMRTNLQYIASLKKCIKTALTNWRISRKATRMVKKLETCHKD